MSNKKLMKKVLIISLSATMAFAAGKSVYASTQALPNGTIITQDGTKFLADSKGEKYSGWFIDSMEDWYYFNETDKTMKTGWHQDDKDGYWYYLSLSDGKMATGWQTIDGKEYFFQPVRDMGNYHFNDEQEKWLYSINNKVPYGAMYVNTITPDGSTVDGSGVKVTTKTTTNNNAGISDTANSGWISENGKWYYYNNGNMIKDQWLNLNGKWYYVISDGTMISNGWHEIGGKSYYFGSDGALYVNATTPDGSKVDGNGVKVVNANVVNLSNYIGVYDLWNADGPGYQMIITSISDNQICGAYAQIFDNKDTHGRYSEFEASLSNNQFTIKGNEVKMQMGEAYEIIGWSGVTGTFSSKYTLTYIDGEPVITGKEYDAHADYPLYLKKIDSLSSDGADYFWEFYSKVQGDYWLTNNNVDIYRNSTSILGKYSGDYYIPPVGMDYGVIVILRYENGIIEGTYKMERRDKNNIIINSPEQFDFSTRINSDGYFKLPNGEEWFLTEQNDGTLVIVAWGGREAWFDANMMGDGPFTFYKE